MKQGISQGSSLSPLLGEFYLLDLDQRLEKLNVKYFRYMDDVLILSSTRWKLREAIRVLNQTFSELRLKKHPDKTFIGRTEKGFDFLGYHFGHEGLSVADETTEKFLARAVQLYVQEQGGVFRLPLAWIIRKALDQVVMWWHHYTCIRCCKPYGNRGINTPT